MAHPRRMAQIPEAPASCPGHQRPLVSISWTQRDISADDLGVQVEGVTW